MKIGIDIRALATKDTSGVGNYLFHALDSILAADKDNDYYLFSSGLNKKMYDWLPWRQANVHRIHLSWPNKILNIFLLSSASIDILKLMKIKLDVFWLPNINFFRSKTQTPIILTIHDLSFLHHREFYSVRRIWWHRLANLRYLVQQAVVIMVISENTKRDLIRFFSIPEDKIKMIAPGIATVDMNKELAKDLTKYFNLPEKYFLFVGTLEPRKNIMAVVKAFDDFYKNHQDYKLVIAGGLGWLYEELLQAIKNRPYIQYLGYVRSPLKEALYYLSQGLLWPSFYEGYGFPPLEALSQGQPVISSFKTSLPEALRDMVLYVDPYNVADLSQTMEKFSDDKKLKELLKNKAKDFKNVTWSDQAPKIINLFREIANYENSPRS